MDTSKSFSCLIWWKWAVFCDFLLKVSKKRGVCPLNHHHVSWELLPVWLLLPFSLCKTPLGETGCLGNSYFLFTGCLSIHFFDSLPFFDTVCQATPSSLCCTVQHLCDVQEVMPCHWSPDASHPPFTASATDLREPFLLSGVFYFTLLSAAFKASLGLAVHPQR